MPPAAPLAGQQLAVAGLAGVSLSQSDQPLDEADAGTTVPRLARALGASLGAGRNVCGSTALPGHRLQSQWLVASGQNGRVETRRRGFLCEARYAQADLGAGTGEECQGQVAGSATAAGVGQGGRAGDGALHPNGERTPRFDGI